MIPCKYKGIGCDTELKREDMAAHEQDDKLHLHMSLETVNSLQDTVTSLQEESMTLDNKGSKIYLIFIRKRMPARKLHSRKCRSTPIRRDIT